MSSAETTQQNQRAASSFTEQDILSWLLEHPEFMLRHANTIAQHHQAEAENITPLHAVRAARAEKNNQTLEKRQQRLYRMAEANADSTASLFTVIPPLIRCQDLPTLRKFLQTTLKKDLQVEAARLILVGEEETATTLPEETIRDLFPANSTVVLRTLYDAQDRHLYGTTGKMLKSDALFLLKNDAGQTLGMLALASADDTHFHPGQGTELASFFGHVVSTVLDLCKS